MRAVLLLLTWMLLTACAGNNTPTAGVPLTSSFPSEVEDLASKTVALTVRKDDGEVRAYCSGVWVSPTRILTANHCVADLNMGELVDYVVQEDVFSPGEAKERDSIRFRSSVLYRRDANHDLALLSSASAPASHGVAKLSGFPVWPGMPVQAMGHPLGLWWSYSRGDVAAVRELESHDMTMLFVQATVPISPGSSGGGLFDPLGQLVGICHGTFTRGQNVNLFIHYQYFEPILGVSNR